jgi:hypothetical protein
LKNKEALLNFKWLSEDGGRPKFAVNLRASSFNKNISNETTFRLIHFAGKYLLWVVCLCRIANNCTTFSYVLVQIDSHLLDIRVTL